MPLLCVLAALVPLSSSADEDSCPAGTWTHFDRAGGGPDNDFVNAIVFDLEGRGYFGTGDLHPPETHGGGLSIRHPDGSWQRIRAAEGALRSNSVYALGRADARILVGSLKGVDVLDGTGDSRGTLAWEQLPERPVPPFVLADALDILVDRRGRQWFATTNGLFVRDGDAWTRHGTSSEGGSLDSRFVTALAESPQGEIWIGTQGKGVAVLAPDGSWTRHRAADGGLGNDYVYDIFFDDRGRAWIGTGIGVSVFADGHWTVHTPGDSPLPDPDVRAIAGDDAGRVWLATHRGLAVVDGGRWSLCGEAPTGPAPEAPSAGSPGVPVPGLGHPLVVSAAAAPDGSLWFGTYGGGVYTWRPEGP